MDVKFGKNTQTAAQVAPEPTECKSLATQPAAGLPASPSGLLLGDHIPDFTEIVLPRINLVQNIGELKNSFPPGALVLNQQALLFTPPVINAKTNVTEKAGTPPVTIVVFGFRPTRYCEKIESSGRGMIVNTEQEVRAAGGTLDYQEWQLKKASGMKRFEPLADAVVAVQAPEGAPADEALFSYEVSGKRYALALWGMRGTSYTEAAKRVFFTARAIGCLREGGYPSWTYSVSAREKPYPSGNKAWVPVCLPKEKTSREFLAFVAAVINSAAAPAANSAPAMTPATQPVSASEAITKPAS